MWLNQINEKGELVGASKRGAPLMHHRKPGVSCVLCGISGTPDQPHIDAERIWAEWDPSGRRKAWTERVAGVCEEVTGVRPEEAEIKEHFSHHEIEQPKHSGALNRREALSEAFELSARQLAIINGLFRQRVLTQSQIIDVFYRPENTLQSAKSKVREELTALAQAHYVFRFKPGEDERGLRGVKGVPRFMTSNIWFLGRRALPYIRDRYDLNDDPKFASSYDEIPRDTLIHDLQANGVLTRLCGAINDEGEIRCFSGGVRLSLVRENWYGPGRAGLEMGFSDGRGGRKQIRPDGFASLAAIWSERGGDYQDGQLPFYYEFDHGSKGVEEVARQLMAYHTMGLSGAGSRRWPELRAEGVSDEELGLAYSIPVVFVFSGRAKRRIGSVLRVFNQIRESEYRNEPPGGRIFVTDEGSWKKDPLGVGVEAWGEELREWRLIDFLIDCNKPILSSGRVRPDTIFNPDLTEAVARPDYAEIVQRAKADRDREAAAASEGSPPIQMATTASEEASPIQITQTEKHHPAREAIAEPEPVKSTAPEEAPTVDQGPIDPTESDSLTIEDQIAETEKRLLALRAKVEAEKAAQVEKAEEEARARAEAEAQAEEEARVRAEAEAQAEEETQSEAQAEEETQSEALLRAEIEARVRAEIEARVRAEIEARAREEAQAEKAAQEEQVRAEAEERAREEAQAEKAAQEEQVRAEAEERAQAEEEIQPIFLPDDDQKADEVADQRTEEDYSMVKPFTEEVIDSFLPDMVDEPNLDVSESFLPDDSATEEEITNRDLPPVTTDLPPVTTDLPPVTTDLPPVTTDLPPVAAEPPEIVIDEGKIDELTGGAIISDGPRQPARGDEEHFPEFPGQRPSQSSASRIESDEEDDYSALPTTGVTPLVSESTPQSWDDQSEEEVGGLDDLALPETPSSPISEEVTPDPQLSDVEMAPPLSTPTPVSLPSEEELDDLWNQDSPTPAVSAQPRSASPPLASEPARSREGELSDVEEALSRRAAAIRRRRRARS